MHRQKQGKNEVIFISFYSTSRPHQQEQKLPDDLNIIVHETLLNKYSVTQNTLNIWTR